MKHLHFEWKNNIIRNIFLMIQSPITAIFQKLIFVKVGKKYITLKNTGTS